MAATGPIPLELLELVAAGITFASSIVVAYVVRKVVKKYLLGYAARTKTTVDDVIVGTLNLPIYLSITLVGANLALRNINTLQPLLSIIDRGFFVLWTLVGGYLTYRVVQFVLITIAERSKIPPTPIHSIRNATRWIIMIVVGVILVGISGADTSGIIPTLLLVLGSIIFLSFAAWSILANVVGGFVIMIWRPFKIGDIIKIEPDGYTGEVVDVNLMFSQLKSKNEEIINIPNTLVLQKFVKNLSTLGIHMLQFEYQEDTSVPRRKMETTLLEAAMSTPGILEKPEPRVSVKEVRDGKVTYELTGYSKEILKLDEIDSTLRINILDHIQRSTEGNSGPIQEHSMD